MRSKESELTCKGDARLFYYEAAMRQTKRWVSTGALAIALVTIWSPSLWANRHYDYSQIDRLSNLNARVNWLLKKGQFQEALEPAEEALRLAKRIYSDNPEHDNVEVSMHTLATVYFNLHRYDEAEKLFKRILEIDEKLLGPDDLEVSRSLMALASVYQAQGRHEEAQCLMDRAEKIRQGFPAVEQSGPPAGGGPQAVPPEKIPEETKKRWEEAKSLPLRTLTFRVAADEEFRRQKDWEKVIQRHIKEASEVYERDFHIRLKIVDMVPWDSENSFSDLEELLLELKKEVQPGGAEIVFGVSGQRPHASWEEKYGEAFPLGNRALVLVPEDRQESRATIGIIHEIGHLFGATHPSDKGSVMHRAATTLMFDAQSAKLILLMRSYDFQRGVAGIDKETKAKLTAMCKEGRVPIKEHPLVGAYANLGSDFARAGKFREAIPAYLEALHYWPDHDEIRQALMAAYSNLAGELVDKGGFDEAIGMLHEARKIDPTLTELRHNLVIAYNRKSIALSGQGKYDEAIAVLQQALGIDPRNRDVLQNLVVYYNNKGLKLMNQSKYRVAASTFKEALKVDPQDSLTRRNLVAAYGNLGISLGTEGRYEEAIAIFREALLIDPDSVHARRSLYIAYGKQGVELLKQSHYEEAISAFEDALRFNTDGPEARRNLEMAFNKSVTQLMDDGNYQEAWSFVDRARRDGVKVHPQTLSVLREKMPEPRREEIIGE